MRRPYVSRAPGARAQRGGEAIPEQSWKLGRSIGLLPAIRASHDSHLIGAALELHRNGMAVDLISPTEGVAWWRLSAADSTSAADAVRPQRQA
jgi:hypothetical protein